MSAPLKILYTDPKICSIFTCEAVEYHLEEADHAEAHAEAEDTPRIGHKPDHGDLLVPPASNGAILYFLAKGIQLMEILLDVTPKTRSHTKTVKVRPY